MANKTARKNVRKAAQEKGKVKRVPFGTVRLKMQLSDEDMAGFKARGMKTYWFNDIDGRIPRALAGGYTFVDPEHATSLGQSAMHGGNTDEGSKVSMIVSRGELEMRAILMEISIKDWKEDQKIKADHIASLMELHEFTGEDTGMVYGTGVSNV